MTEYYYLNSRNEPQGPHSLDELADMMASGRVNPTTLIACKGASSWEPLGSILSRENIRTPELSISPGQVGNCPTCGHDLAHDMAEHELPTRCPSCNRALRPEKKGIWANYCQVLRNYARFSGRATRAEYWSFQLVNIVICFILYIGLIIPLIISLFNTNKGALKAFAEHGDSMSEAEAAQLMTDSISQGAPQLLAIFLAAFIVLMLYGLFILIPSIAVSVRRLHDVGWSGWWIAGSFVFGLVLNIVVAIMEVNVAEDETAVLTSSAGILIPVLASYTYNIFLFVLTLLDSKRGPNQYGPSPKYPLG